jgi:hypothetical protein
LTLVEEGMVVSPESFMDWVCKQVVGNKVAWASTDPDTVTNQAAWQARMAQGENIQYVPCVLAPLIGKMAFRRALQGDVRDALSIDANYVRRSYVEVFQKGTAHVPGK